MKIWEVIYIDNSSETIKADNITFWWNNEKFVCFFNNNNDVAIAIVSTDLIKLIKIKE